jgi:hypothetical protein
MKQSPQLMKKFTHLMEHKGSLLHSQLPAICPHSMPDRSSAYLLMLLRKDPFS